MDQRQSAESAFLEYLNPKVASALKDVSIELSGRENEVAIDYRPSVLEEKIKYLELRANGQQMKLTRNGSSVSEADRQDYKDNLHQAQILDEFAAVLKDTQSRLLDAKGKPARNVDREAVVKNLLDAAQFLDGDSQQRALMLGSQLRAIAGGKTGGSRGFAGTTLPLVADEIARAGRRSNVLWQQRLPVTRALSAERLMEDTRGAHQKTIAQMQQMKSASTAVREVWANALAEESLSAKALRRTEMEVVHPAEFETAAEFDSYVDQISRAAVPSLKISEPSQRGINPGGLGL